MRVFTTPADSKAVLVNVQGRTLTLTGCITPPTRRTIAAQIGPYSGGISLEINTPPLLWIQDFDISVYYPTSAGWHPFQYDNVYFEGRICWGRNRGPRSLREAYNLFWSSPYLDEVGIKNSWNGSVGSYHTCGKFVGGSRCPPTHQCRKFLLPDCRCRCCSDGSCYCWSACRCCTGSCTCNILRGGDPNWIAFRKALLTDYVQTVADLQIPQPSVNLTLVSMSETAKGFVSSPASRLYPKSFAHPVEKMDGDWVLEPTATDPAEIIPQEKIELL